MITLTFAAWMIPTAITFVAVMWALFCVDGGGGAWSGLANLMALVPALAVSLIAWIIYAVVK